MSRPTNPWKHHTASRLLLALDGWALLPHLSHFDMLNMLVLGLLWLWAILWHLGRLSQPGNALRATLTLLLAILVLASQSGRLDLYSGSALLGVMLLMKTLEIRSPRDFYTAIVALLFLQAALLFGDNSWWWALHGLVLLQGMLWLLYLLARDPEAKHPHWPCGHWHHFIPLWLWGLPLGLALFLLFPRLPQPLWGLPLDSSGRTGLSEHLQPGDLGELFLDDTPVFRASQFQPSMPPVESMYWRAMVMWHFDGRGWKRAWLPLAAGETPSQMPVLEYSLVHEAYPGNWLVALDWPAGGDYNARLTLDGQWISNQRWQPAAARTLQATDNNPMTTLHPLERIRGLQLPRNGNPRARAWARQLRQQAGSDAQLAQRILDHFRQEDFFYSLSPPPLGPQPVDEFLFHTRSGYCEHYASAFTFLMRAAGVPARVVTGYQGGLYNPLGDYVLVRKSDAHAWSEIWLEGQGWVRVDPTSAVAPERVQSDIRAQQQAENRPQQTLGLWLRQQLDWLAYRWNRWFLRYNHQLQRQLWLDLHTMWRQWSAAWPALLVLPLIALAWHWTKRDAQARAWYRLRKRLSRTSNPPPAHLGPEALAGWCREQLANGEQVAEWIELWLRYRYGAPPQPPLPPPPEIREKNG